MANSVKMVYGACFSLFVYVIALGVGYVWIRAMHYPFTLRQRKMWIYYVLFLSALPVLGEVFLALRFWVMPIEESAEITIAILIVWMVVALFIVRRIAKSEGSSDSPHEETN